MTGRVWCATALALVILALAPFAVALEIHHELAAADHDGHEHSEFDLCQWVQHHTGQSMVALVPPMERDTAWIPGLIRPEPRIATAVLALSVCPRAPPTR